MNEAAGRWHESAGAFALRIAAVADDQWERATPCDQWSVRQLVDHVIATQTRFGGLLGLQTESAEWTDLYQAMVSLLAGEDVLEGSVNVGPLGTMSKVQVLDVCTNDLLIHTWDLARAIGFSETLPVDAVSSCYEWLRNLPVELVRSPGRYVEAVIVGADADMQTMMLAFAGRQP